MASYIIKCEEFAARQHNNDNNPSSTSTSTAGWHDWETIKTTKNDGYGYASKKGTSARYVTALRFKVQTTNADKTVTQFPTGGKVVTLKITLRVEKTSSGSSSGTMYAKWYGTTDPTKGDSKLPFKEINNIIPDANDTSIEGVSWTSKKTVTLTFTGVTVTPGKYHYITLGSSTLVQIYSSETAGANQFSGETEYYKNVTVEKPKIIDKKDGTFCIEATEPVDADNNTITSSTLSLKRGGDAWVNVEFDNRKIYGLSCASDTAARVVKAKITVKTQRGDNPSVESDEATINNYQVATWPNATDELKLDASSLKNGRLTLKKNWSYSWTAATQANTVSPVAGYRIRLWRSHDGASRKIAILDADGNILSTNSGTDIFYDRDDTSTSIIIYPAKYGDDLQVNDSVMLEVRPYVLDGNNRKVISSSTENPIYVKFTVFERIQNSGVLKVKVPTIDNKSYDWVEGQVWVKVPVSGTDKTGTWVEADTVKVKTTDDWQESQ